MIISLLFGPSSLLHSAENLAVRWLETRSAEELEVYPHIVAIAHNIISEAFSRRVITPGVTTTDDVVWWIRERICGLHSAGGKVSGRPPDSDPPDPLILFHFQYL